MLDICTTHGQQTRQTPFMAATNTCVKVRQVLNVSGNSSIRVVKWCHELYFLCSKTSLVRRYTT